MSSSETPQPKEESLSNSEESKEDVWAIIPGPILAKAICRSSDETRAELARNIKDCL